MTIKQGRQLEATLRGLLEAKPPAGLSSTDLEQIQRLADRFYRHVALEDLEEYGPQDLLGAVIAHWRLLRNRKPDQFKVRVYSPVQEEDGWCSRDTIVEIVSRDMPFLVDSLTAAINRQGQTVRLTLHPIIRAERDNAGQLQRIVDDAADAVATAEAVIRLHVDRQPPDALDALQASIVAVIEDVVTTTSDWLKMRQQAEQAMTLLSAAPHEGLGGDVEEYRHFLSWVINDHFLFVGTCRFVYECRGDVTTLRFDAASGRGLLHAGPLAEQRALAWTAGLEGGVADDDGRLLVTKANARSTVHRSAYMDCIAIKEFDATGSMVGLRCLIGLFSAAAYTAPPRQIPLLRRKVEKVFERAEILPASHSGRVLGNILDNFPRDTLFQVNDDELLETTLGVLGLQERQRTRLFVLKDPFRRFVTCLVYLPREQYSRDVRLAIQAELATVFSATDVFSETQFSESILARIHFVVWLPTGYPLDFHLAGLETRIIELATTWLDGLRLALEEQVEETLAAKYFHDYQSAFPGGYREDCHPRVAVDDIQRIEAAKRQDTLVLHLYHPIVEHAEQLHVRLYSPQGAVPLSKAIPILEHMGLTVFGERPYKVHHADGDFWIHDFSTRRPESQAIVSAEVRERFVEAFGCVWRGETDDDGFNGLVLIAGISWREALLLRAYAAYLRQIKLPYTQAYMLAALARHPITIRLLLDFFKARFGAAMPVGRKSAADLPESLAAALDALESLDDDRILRSFVNLVQATLRTNFYQTNATGAPKPYLSFKFNPQSVTAMPSPRPMFEVFVYAVVMEGVHLRGGRVARGGLRWSDRMEDYRTEVLGLMKAQMVKNTVIVPVGAKGGFVVKNLLPSDSMDARHQKGIAAYRMLLSGMLDLTDNLQGGQVLRPNDVTSYDDPDPYLVIAADKGTATFSDTANALAAEYRFWLGDAFASGGSAGYDHKAMGITARGAWESVKRNFRELGVNIQETPFRVVGIGDMAGDVFGNGMLLSPFIKLVGAFNHRHIFLDPVPDLEAAFSERQRLFKLPRSNWSDYDRQIISPGGGVYSRDAKSIPLSAQVQQLLGLRQARLTPNELIRALLKAPVDLLWNGGIGTYVKASDETHQDVNDKANDNVRVDASSLRCRVVGEGGNLGFTQLARVEYALQGGMIYTDAIDNSGGVDCSDHEVNIKILLDRIVASGDLTLKQRNQLLEQMTDDVARMVLSNNDSQTRSVSVVVSGAPQRLYEHARFMDLLELKGNFDRESEGLPVKKTLTTRLARGEGLVKPEIAVLLAYSKMNYTQSILASDIPDDAFVEDRLAAYFPPVLRDRFGEAITGHPLRREILATAIAGAIADHVGPGIGFRVREEVGSDIAAVARAYLVASAIFETDALWQQVESLDDKIAANTQTAMLALLAEFLEQTLTAVLRAHRTQLDMAAVTNRYRQGVQTLIDCIPSALAAQERTALLRRQRRFERAGVPPVLSRRIAGLPALLAALDIIDVAKRTSASISDATWVHSALNHTLDIDWIQTQIGALPVQTHWHLLARAKLQALLNQHRRDLTAWILEGQYPKRSARSALDRWVRRNRDLLDRYTTNVAEFKAGGVFDFAILSLVVARLGELLPGSPTAAR